jgi:hypothetical protein
LQGADADLPAPPDVPAMVFTYSDRIDIDVDFVIGSMYSAMPEHQIARADRPRFERGLRDALATHAATAPLVDVIEATMFVGRTRGAA